MNFAFNFPFNFSYDVPELSWVLVCILVLSAAIALQARFLPIIRAGKAVKPFIRPEERFIEEEAIAEDENSGDSVSEEIETEDKVDISGINKYVGVKVPKVSVIVYSITEEEEIHSYLEMVMNQDYPDYEVILVNEGSYDTTTDLAERLLAIYPERLYVTFIPHDAHSLSRRKLAQTVGMKAAKGDIVVTTMSNCEIPSLQWLSEMANPFIFRRGTDVVLGYSHIDFDNLHGAGAWYRDMDAFLTSCQWIGAAYNGYPYRGDGANLAFRRHLFFEQKGYAKTLHLMNGDDDLFLREIIDGSNTVTSISAGSILKSEWGVSGNRIHADMKERYQFTSRFLPKWPFLRAGLGSAMQWVMLAAAVAALIIGLPSLLPGCVALFLLFATWLVQIIIYRRTARKLQSVCLWWSLPWFLLWHPIGNLVFRLRRFSYRRKNYTFA